MATERDYERKSWSFRGDYELDPILKKWSKQSEKSFHVRQALRQYLLQGRDLIEGTERNRRSQG